MYVGNSVKIYARIIVIPNSIITVDFFTPLFSFSFAFLILILSIFVLLLFYFSLLSLHFPDISFPLCHFFLLISFLP